MRHHRWAIVIVALVPMIVGVSTYYGIRSLRQAVADAPKSPGPRRRPMATLTSGPWMSGGVPRTVTTHQQESETPAAHAARHKTTYEAMLAAFPKDS